MTQPVELSAHRGLSFLLSCLNIYFPPQSPWFLLRGSDGDDSFMKSTPRAITELFLHPWIRESRASRIREPIRVSANKEIVDLRLFHFFRATCPPHFIALHGYLNSAAVVGPSIFCSATGGCRKMRERDVKMVRRKQKIHSQTSLMRSRMSRLFALWVISSRHYFLTLFRTRIFSL